MKMTWKNLCVFVLVAAVSSGVAVGTSIYLFDKKQSASANMVEGVFAQPVRMTNLASVAAENIDFTVAAESAVHAVVHIKSKATVQGNSSQHSMDPFDFFFGNRGFQRPESRPRVGSGSGVIISTDGYIMTNNHVVESADEIEVTLNDNRTFSAKVIGRDTQTDIALIKIEGNNFPTIPFGDSEKLKVGEWVLAVGNPFNLTSTVTAGIVSAKGRSISMGRSKIESFIQTDAAVNPGNSGGALVNTKGELVGINTAIYSETGNFAGYSFAVPITIAGKVVADLKQYGTVQRAVLGVMGGNVSDLKDKEKENVKVLEGAYISEFSERSSAKEAGLEVGDVIVKLNNENIRSFNVLQEQIAKCRPGDKVKVTVDRKGTTKTFTVELRNAQGSTDIVKIEGVAETLGAAFKALSSETKRQLGVSYGVEVAGLTNGKLQDAGVKKGYIIMVVNDKKVSSPEEIEKIVENILKGNAEDKVLFIKGFYPNGRSRYFAIDLSPQDE